MIADSFFQIDISNLTPGDDWRLAIPLADVVWEPGDTARCHWRTGAKANEIALNLTTGNGRIELNAGEIAFVVASSDTAAILPGSYVWDVEITRAGQIDTFIEGRCTLRQDITR